MTINKVDLVRRANEAGRSSRHGGAPTLTVASTAEAIARWLQWCDPNGCHTADLARAEDCDCYDDESAWDALSQMLA